MNKNNLSLAFYLFIFAANTAFAGHFHYSYDAAGNRISRSFSAQKIAVPHSNSPSKAIADTKHDIKVAPNPTTGIVSLSITNLAKDESGSVVVVDLNGTIVYSLKSISAANSLDLSSLPNGVYIMNVEISGMKTSWKIVKQN
ncbi:MAG: T9SS type A sorting domain-containing protein [Candidatus Kapabacteria bacterium]|nr:T9SS type A sorting domain-containing protein [Candidatus Kapabacteria bacterium]